MKLAQLITARNTLLKHKDVETNPSAAYKIMKFLKASDDDEIFYRDEINKILERFAEKTEDGCASIPRGSEQEKEAYKAVEELDNTAANEPILKLTLDDLTAFKLSVAEMATLDAFIED